MKTSPLSAKSARLIVALAVLLTTGIAVAAGAGRIREIEIDTPRSGPSIVVAAPDGAIWSSLARASRLLRVAPDGSRREFPLPEGSFPVGLLAEQDGTLWYSDVRRNQIVHFHPERGVLRAYDVPTRESFPFFLVKDARGRLYFTQRVGNKLGRLDPDTGRIDEFPVARPGAQPAGMTITSDGHIFFTQNSANRIGHFDPATERLVDILIPSPATPGPYYGPAGIASSADGDVWFCQLDGRLGLIRRADRTRIEEFALPDPKVRPGGVAVDRSGLVWYTGLDGNMIGSFHPPSRSFRAYPLPSGAADPRPMTPPEVSARGEQPIPGMQARSTRPFGITVDAADRIWFAEQYGHRLGVLEPPTLDVLAPVGIHTGPDADVTWLDRSRRGSGSPSVQVDGATQRLVGGRIDLLGLDPGRHRLTLALPGGERTASSEFVLQPDLDFVAAALARHLRSHRSPALDTAWRRVDEARRMDDPVAIRNGLAAARTALLDDAGADAARVRRQLLYLEMFGGIEARVAIDATGCSPSERVIQRGDRVVWKATGDAARRPTRVSARDGSFSSPQIAGEWSHRFDREGRFEYACGNGTATVRVQPRVLTAAEHRTAEPGRVPTVLVVDSAHVWAAAGGGGYASLSAVPLNNRILRLSMDGRMTEYATPTPESAPTSIKPAPDGSLWFTERAAGKIGRLDPASGTIREYAIPTADSTPTGIAVDHRDGSVWFTEKQAGKIGRYDPARGTFEEFATPHPNSEPSTIVFDHEGHVWFDERGADHLVRMNPQTREVRMFRVPTKGSRVIGLVPDKRGYMWFLELAGQKIGRLDVASGQILEYEIPTRNASPFKAVLDAHGRLWFTQAYGNRIGVLQDGRVHEFLLQKQGAMPGGIEIGGDGSLWFTQQAADVIARLHDVADVYAPERDVPDRGIARTAAAATATASGP